MTDGWRWNCKVHESRVEVIIALCLHIIEGLTCGWRKWQFIRGIA